MHITATNHSAALERIYTILHCTMEARVILVCTIIDLVFNNTTCIVHLFHGCILVDTFECPFGLPTHDANQQ
jgi:hypothetical protein